jgi:hypothetical protein
MPTGTPDVPLDSNGRPLKGVALEGHLRRQAELDAAEQAREDVAALARMVCRLAARELGMPAPDALSALGARVGSSGQEDALRCLRAAGHVPDVQAQRWAAEAPVQAQHSTGRGYDGDPEHHPEVVALITTPGTPMSAVIAKIAEVAERQQAEREQAAAADPGLLWVTREGIEVRESRHPTPLRPQRSLVRQGVPELGSEPA